MNNYYIQHIYVSGMPGTPLVDMDFEETPVITGESASGKTVLLRIIAGLYDYIRVGDIKCLSTMLCCIQNDEWYGRIVTWYHLFDVAKIWLGDGTSCEVIQVDHKNGIYTISMNNSEPVQVKLPEVVYPRNYALVFMDAGRCSRYGELFGALLEEDGFTLDFDGYAALCERILGEGAHPMLPREQPVRENDNANKWKAKVENWLAFLGHGEKELLLLYIYSRRPGVILIDELHSGFHPLSQPRLARYVLGELGERGVQVIYTTTSPFCKQNVSDKVAEMAYKSVINTDATGTDEKHQ